MLQLGIIHQEVSVLVNNIIIRYSNGGLIAADPDEPLIGQPTPHLGSQPLHRLVIVIAQQQHQVAAVGIDESGEKIDLFFPPRGILDFLCGCSKRFINVMKVSLSRLKNI